MPKTFYSGSQEDLLLMSTESADLGYRDERGVLSGEGTGKCPVVAVATLAPDVCVSLVLGVSDMPSLRDEGTAWIGLVPEGVGAVLEGYRRPQ